MTEISVCTDNVCRKLLRLMEMPASSRADAFHELVQGIGINHAGHHRQSRKASAWGTQGIRTSQGERSR